MQIQRNGNELLLVSILQLKPHHRNKTEINILFFVHRKPRHTGWYSECKRAVQPAQVLAEDTTGLGEGQVTKYFETMLLLSFQKRICL